MLRILSALLLVAAAAAVATGSEPAAPSPSIADLKGFAEIEFGDSLEVAKKKHPEMRPVSTTDTRLNAAAIQSPHLVREVIGDYKLGNVPTPVQVELRFWRDQLWAVVVYYDRGESEAVLKYLDETYGPRTSGTPQRPIWSDDRVQLQVVTTGGWYGATSKSISEDARSWFFKKLSGHAAAADEGSSKPAEKHDHSHESAKPVAGSENKPKP